MYYSATICFLLSAFTLGGGLRCFVGSKGIINGVPSSNFVENTCEDGMTHCFESFSDDLTEITASCQTPNTEQKLLDVCKVGCQNHTSLQVTVCCCDTDLCNRPRSENLTAQPIDINLLLSHPKRINSKISQ